MIPGLTSSKLCMRWIIAVLVCSAVAAFDDGALTHWLALVPIKVLHGQLWRLATWPLVEAGPFSLILTAIAIIRFGDPLASAWGDKRLQRFIVHIALGTGMATTLFATLAGGAHVMFLGGWAMSSALVIAYARQFPYETFVIYGVRFGGPRLIGIMVLACVAYAIYGRAVVVAPELAACGLAIAYPREMLRRR